MNATSLEKATPIILRIGLGLVMLWFGSQQLMDASSWTGFLPDFVASLPVSAIAFVKLNGLFEVAFGILLIAGFFVRFTALFLALHLFGIVFAVGYSAVAVRDFGLSMALLALSASGAGTLSLDSYFERKQ